MEENIDFFYNKFNLDKETENIFEIIIDNFPNDGRTATSNYSYRIILENRIELNLSYIDEDFYLDFYFPIVDYDMANYYYSIYFSNRGIYNKSSKFYNDYCSPAFEGENDITLKDRKKYIYPNNVILCKDNCKYNGVERENGKIICSIY